MLQVFIKMERATGIEPVTSSLGSWHSTAELRPLRAWRTDFLYGIAIPLSMQSLWSLSDNQGHSNSLGGQISVVHGKAWQILLRPLSDAALIRTLQKEQIPLSGF